MNAERIDVHRLPIIAYLLLRTLKIKGINHFCMKKASLTAIYRHCLI